ncbi:xanthotoxin 5-hydroxylase CYP82C4-like [Aristolochia californica]|uniref:xanthotoxin 5-hydroxylase CYP82C4-like n=1 Tax=Aristolochia californica TaxID=171875 RepID=UPI0035E18684
MEMPLLLQALFALLALLLVHKLWTVRNERKKGRKKSPPEPSGGWPIIGHLHLLGGPEPLYRTLGEMADSYGPSFLLRLGLRRTLVISSWEVAKECFTTNDKALASRPTSASGDNMSYEYAMFGFAPYGAYWREMRRIATLELLCNRRVDSLKHVRFGEIDAFLKEMYRKWVKNGRSSPVKMEMKQRLFELTFNIVVGMIMGKRFFGTDVCDEAEAHRVTHFMEQSSLLSGSFVLSDSLPFLKWLDLQGLESSMRKTADELDALVERWVQEHRARRLSGEAQSTPDFMDVMISILENAQLTTYDPDTIIKATCLILVQAGTDTTAVALTWALSLLLNNRRVLKKVLDELDIHVGRERLVDESDIKNLQYLHVVIKETLRLYPPAPLGIPHQATEDCNVNGAHIQAGTRVMVNLWKLHRDPRIWSDASEFRPERFLTTHVGLDIGAQNFEFMPFGSGRRSCPGMGLALPVLHLTLARILQAFELGTQNDSPVDMTERLHITITREKPLDVLFTPRLSQEFYE